MLSAKNQIILQLSIEDPDMIHCMNLIALQTFLTILESGSLVRAAESLNVTQSTVTARLKTLEAELGQVLVTRQKSGAIPTAAGLRLKRYAETMGELWRQAKTEVALPGNIQSVCNIGCHPDLWHETGQSLFDTIRKDQPDVALSVWHGGQIELSAWLNNGLIDIALTYWPSTRPGHSTSSLLEDQLILVSTNPQAPLRFDPGYVYVEAGDAFGRWHAATYADADVPKLSFGSAVLALQHILQLGGSAYLPKRIAAPLLADGKLHQIEDGPAFERPAYLCVNARAAESWPWFDDILQRVGQQFQP